MEREIQISPGDVHRDRRQFLAKMASAVFASMVAPGLAQGVPQAPATPLTPQEEDALLRMQKELERALKNPNRRWGMVIDLRKCVGCHACTVSCMAENRLPPGVVYRPVSEEEVGTFPHVTYRFVPRPCMQCDEPPCVPACPYDATWKRKDGIVEIDYELCVGCEKCIPPAPTTPVTRTTATSGRRTPRAKGRCPMRNSPSTSGARR